MVRRESPFRTRRSPLATSAALVVLAIATAACSSDGGTAGPGTTDGSTAPPAESTIATDPTTEPTSDGRGWIGGEPDWSASGSGGAFAEDGVAADMESGGAPRLDSPTAAGPGQPVDEHPMPPVDDSPLRAGSVDDNAEYADYLAYLARVGELGITLREYAAGPRTIVTVVDADGRPAHGVEVTATPVDTAAAGGATAIRLRTTADGTVRFMPALYGASDGTYTFAVGDVAVEAAVGEDITLTLPTSSVVGDPVPLDVLFLLDATGSMGDEIDRLKTTIDSVAQRVSGLDPRPDVRFAMTLYRDEGDTFVASTYDFTGSVDDFRAALSNVVADGGGDYPEALEEGLAAALGEPTWRDPSQAVQLVFLVADAPPQIARQVETPYTDSLRNAIGRGIKIFPVASSESDDQAEAVFRQLAQATGAPFVFLSYGAGGAATGEHTDIDSTDYEELALDDLVVRLISEELADLAGSDTPPTPPPTTTPPSTTVPEGQ